MARMPAIFISHGMPSMAIEPGPTASFLSRLPRGFPQPRAIVCVSAHLEGSQALVTADARPETLHDFGGSGSSPGKFDDYLWFAGQFRPLCTNPARPEFGWILEPFGIHHVRAPSTWQQSAP